MISKLPDVGTTIFSVMSALSNECNALNLSQGFPEFDTDSKLKDLVGKYMQNGYNQYAPMPGIPELRNALAVKMQSAYEVSPWPDDITITAGATEAIFSVITAIVASGDEVIVFDPAYDCYDPAIRLNGGIPVHLKLYPPYFRLPLDELEKQITSKTKLVIINNPHNPLGVVVPEEDMERLQGIIVENDLYLLSDEVYEHITFDNHKHTSVMNYPKLYERSFVTFSFGKTFHNTGWKMGYCVAPNILTKELRKVHQFNVFSCNTPIQYALAEYLSDASTYSGIGTMYQAKRDLFAEAISGSRFKPLHCQGTYFILLDYSEISDEPDTEMAVQLTREFGIASIPISVFYQDGYDKKLLRFCFAKNDDTLLKAGKILCQI